MPNARRRAKKHSFRGRIATAVMEPGQKEWIPGIPAYHEGSPPGQSAELHDAWHAVFDDPNAPPSGDGNNGGSAPEVGDVRTIDVEGVGTITQQFDGSAWITIPSSQITRPPAGGVGTTTPALTQFQEELYTRQQDLAELIAEIDARNANSDREADRAIAAGNTASAEKIEAARRYMEALQLRYTQERDVLDRYLQQYQLATSTRGQDITQRGQSIDAMVALNSELISLYQAEGQIADMAGAQDLARDAEDRLRSTQQQTAALDQFSAELSASAQSLQAQTMGGQQLGTLAGLEQQRQQDLIGLSQDPRDFMGLMNAMGGGQNFLNQLSAGRPITGQSATTGMAPIQQGTLDQLLSMIGPTPVFDQATAAAGALGQFQPPTPPSMHDRWPA